MEEHDPHNWSSFEDGLGLSTDGGSGDAGTGDSTHLVARLTESALSAATFERKAAARGLLEAFRQTCFTEEDVASVIAVIDKLMEDSEQGIRVEVMEQLPHIAFFCHEEGPYLDYVVPQHILPHIVNHLTDKFTQVRKTSQSALLLLVERKIIHPSQVEQHICPVILEYTGSRAHEDYRTEIAQFMSKLAPLVGKEITVKSYLERFSTLCQDTLFQVRRTCAVTVGDISSVVDTNLTEEVLLPQFLKLCKDEVWGVRKGCAESIFTISSICRLSTRRSILTPIFVCLLKDPSRWVKLAACQTLGPFITTFMLEESENTEEEYSELELKYLEENGRGQKGLGLELCHGILKELESKDMLYGPTSSAKAPVISRYPVSRSLISSSALDDDNSDEEDLTDEEVVYHSVPKTFDDDNLTSEPMDTENEEKLDENSRLVCSSRENDDAQFSFEERRSLAYELKCTVNDSPEATETDINQNQSSDSPSTLVAKLDENSTSTITNSSNQYSPSVSVSSKADDTVEYHIHVTKDSTAYPETVTKSLALIADQGQIEIQQNYAGYNTWQYWRVPIPDIELDIDMLDGGKKANVHVRAKVADPQNRCLIYSSEINVGLILEKPNEFEKRNEGERRKAQDDLKQELEGDSETKDTNSEKLNKTVETLKINAASTSSVQSLVEGASDGKKSVIIDSAISNTVVSVQDGRVSDVHRSYMNLYNASTRENKDQGFEDAGFESLKLGDNCYDDDSDEQLSSSFQFGDEYPGNDWGSKSTRGKLLMELPKSNISDQQDVVPTALLDHFTALCEPNKEHQSIDSDLASFCVYNFPAVVLTLGPQNWSLLRDCYEALACNMQWKVRYTLAASLHEIAKILGPELSERDLVPFYNALTKDLDEVRIGILRNLASFVKILGSDARKRVLESLQFFISTENTRNWRFRLELADQIQKLSEMFEAEEIYKHLCPVSMNLIQDKVCEVRKKALSVVPFLVTRLNYTFCKETGRESSVVREYLLDLVKSLGHSEQWVKRQAFASLSGQLVEIGAMSPAQFAQDILPHLINLSEDKVPNVRLVVAQTLSASVFQMDYFADPSNPHKDILNNTLIKLQDDEDQDVRYFSQTQMEDEDEL